MKLITKTLSNEKYSKDRSILKPFVGEAVIIEAEKCLPNERLVHQDYVLYTGITVERYKATLICDDIGFADFDMFSFDHAYLPANFKMDGEHYQFAIITEYKRRDGSVSYGFKNVETDAERKEAWLRSALLTCRIVQQKASMIERPLSREEIHELADNLDEMITRYYDSCGEGKDWKGKLTIAKYEPKQPVVAATFRSAIDALKIRLDIENKKRAKRAKKAKKAMKRSKGFARTTA